MKIGASKTDQERIISTISFPYADLENAIEVAKAIHDFGGTCSRDQLAGQLKQMPTSGAFGVKLGAARIFGLVELVGQKYGLTQTGYAILDSNESRVKAAKIDAFLSVPLYKRTYEEYRNKLLPPRLGLEQAFVGFGVSVKQKDKARIVFERSAQFAGFFNAGKDRLIEPASGGSLSNGPSEAKVSPQPEATVPSRTQSEAHPLLDGLFREIPKPGDEWSLTAQARWLQTAANVFGLLYPEKEPSGHIAVELKAL